MSILDSAAAVAAGAAILEWIHLLTCRHGFWRADQRLQPSGDGPSHADVVAVIPARNEADVVGPCVASLLRQTHMPPLRLILVDDESEDGTRDVASDAARCCDAADRMVIVSGAPRPNGWTGKMWAVAQGISAAQRMNPRYLLLGDADIKYDPDVVRQLVTKAEAEGLDLVSLMIHLHCRSFVERLLIPAFVFFFQLLYPFPAVNDRRATIAAAAGGCMLVRAEALRRAGGIESIRDALIDDCALARRLKSSGPIWLGLTDRSASLRAYRGVKDIWRMVARTAYTQLDYSPLRLLVTVAGMVLIYGAAPIALTAGMTLGAGVPVMLGAVAWALMGLAYAPTLGLYRLSPLWALMLPASALLYTMMTVDSARRHWLGQGAEWKGRLYGGLAADPRMRAGRSMTRCPIGRQGA